MFYPNLFTIDGAARLVADSGNTVDEFLDRLDTASAAAIYKGVDEFVHDAHYEYPTVAIRDFAESQQELSNLKESFGLSNDDVAGLRDYLIDHGDEIEEEVDSILDDRQARYEREHPPVPEGFIALDTLQESLDLGELGAEVTKDVVRPRGHFYFSDDIHGVVGMVAGRHVDTDQEQLLHWLPDNLDWIAQAEKHGLLAESSSESPSARQTFFNNIQVAQKLSLEHEILDHRTDISLNIALEDLKGTGIYAISEQVADELTSSEDDYLNCDLTNPALDLNKEIGTNAIDVVDRTLDEDVLAGTLEELVPAGYGILDDSALLSDYNTLRDFGMFSFPNHCAMSSAMCRDLSETGRDIDTAIKEHWEPVIDRAVTSDELLGRTGHQDSLEADIAAFSAAARESSEPAQEHDIGGDAR